MSFYSPSRATISPAPAHPGVCGCWPAPNLVSRAERETRTPIARAWRSPYRLDQPGAAISSSRVWVGRGRSLTCISEIRSRVLVGRPGQGVGAFHPVATCAFVSGPVGSHLVVPVLPPVPCVAERFVVYIRDLLRGPARGTSLRARLPFFELAPCLFGIISETRPMEQFPVRYFMAMPPCSVCEIFVARRCTPHETALLFWGPEPADRRGVALS